MRLLILIQSILSFSILAQLNYMPPAFNENNRKLIFMDIQRAHYEMEFKANNSIKVISRLDFKIYQSGYPLFDLVPSESLKVYYPAQKRGFPCLKEQMKYDDQCLQEVKFDSTNLGTYTERMFYVDKNYFYPRDHINSLYFFYTINDANMANRWVRNTGFNFVFEFCDGNSGRQLLERYLPANFQFDQYASTMELKFDREYKQQIIVANDIEEKRIKYSDYYYILTYPEFYNSASIFFHTFPKGYYFELPKFEDRGVEFYFYGKRSLFFDHEYIPGMGGYLKQKNVKGITASLMEEFTSTLGKFPHKKMIVYIGESFSGIEHFGATRTSFFSLGHEIYHQYIGRGILPADGRSAWIDEGLARWRDGGHWFWRWLSEDIFADPYSMLEELPNNYVGLPDQSLYQRKTRNPHYEKDHHYSAGALFFSHINYLLDDHLNDFLNEFVQSKVSAGDYLYDQQDFKIALTKWAHQQGYDAGKIMDLFEEHFNQNKLD